MDGIPSGRTPRWAARGLQVLAIMLAAYAFFRTSLLWRMYQVDRAYALSEPGLFAANFPRYLIGVLWPLPGAALLFWAGGRLAAGVPRWWLPAIAAGVWLAGYLLVQPPHVYYYWLIPSPK
jgi:hypothetical protein